MADNLNKIEVEILDALYKRECENDIDLEIKYTMFSLVGDAKPSQEAILLFDFIQERLMQITNTQ